MNCVKGLLSFLIKRKEIVLISFLSIVEFVYLSIELRDPDQKIYQWDWLLISGIPTFIIAFWQAQDIDKKFETALTRCFQQEILQIKLNGNGEKKTYIFKKFLELIQRKSIKFSGLASLFFALIILLSFAYSYLRPPWEKTIPLTVFETFLALIAGWHLGEILFNGTLLGFVEKQKKSCFKAQFEHPDKVGGLKILTDFYSYQAKVAAYPVIYLAVWVLILQGCHTFIPRECIQNYTTYQGEKISLETCIERQEGSNSSADCLNFFREKCIKKSIIPQKYLSEVVSIYRKTRIPHYIDRWRIPYIFLLIIATSIEFLAFFIPLFFLHKILEREKPELLKQADSITSEYRKIKGEIKESKSNTEYIELNRKVSILEAEYLNLEKMSTWPISSQNFLGFIQRYFLPGITSIGALIEPITKIYQTISNNN